MLRWAVRVFIGLRISFRALAGRGGAGNEIGIGGGEAEEVVSSEEGAGPIRRGPGDRGAQEGVTKRARKGGQIRRERCGTRRFWPALNGAHGNRPERPRPRGYEWRRKRAVEGATEVFGRDGGVKQEAGYLRQSVDPASVRRSPAAAAIPP